MYLNGNHLPFLPCTAKQLLIDLMLFKLGRLDSSYRLNLQSLEGCHIGMDSFSHVQLCTQIHNRYNDLYLNGNHLPFLPCTAKQLLIDLMLFKLGRLDSSYRLNLQSLEGCHIGMDSFSHVQLCTQIHNRYNDLSIRRYAATIATARLTQLD